jgi:nucleotide-binding universal stress UspA family protein
VALVPLGWDGGRRWGTLGAAFVDSADGRDAVRGAHALARRAGAALRVVAAVHPRAWMVRGASFDDVAAELRTAAETAAEAAVAGLVGAPVDVDVAVGEVADLLTGVSGDVELLVCGSRGYGPSPAALLGGATGRLVEAAACPVIVVARGAAVALDGEVAALEAELEAMRRAAEDGDLHEQVEHDVGFHRLIVEASGNRTLLDVWLSLRVEARTVITALKIPIDGRELAELHRPILDALRDRDADRAGNAVRRHVEHFGELLLRRKESS